MIIQKNSSHRKTGQSLEVFGAPQLLADCGVARVGGLAAGQGKAARVLDDEEGFGEPLDLPRGEISEDSKVPRQISLVGYDSSTRVGSGLGPSPTFSFI
jgi:hypothetical protein